MSLDPFVMLAPSTGSHLLPSCLEINKETEEAKQARGQTAARLNIPSGNTLSRRGSPKPLIKPKQLWGGLSLSALNERHQ